MEDRMAKEKLMKMARSYIQGEVDDINAGMTEKMTRSYIQGEVDNVNAGMTEKMTFDEYVEMFEVEFKYHESEYLCPESRVDAYVTIYEFGEIEAEFMMNLIR